MDYGTIRILIWIVVLVLSLVSTTAMHTLHFAHVSTRACVFFYQEARKKKREREIQHTCTTLCTCSSTIKNTYIFIYFFCLLTEYYSISTKNVTKILSVQTRKRTLLFFYFYFYFYLFDFHFIFILFLPVPRN